MTNKRNRAPAEWTRQQMLWLGLGFCCVFLLVNVLVRYAFEDSSPSWPAEIVRAFIVSVWWVFAMRWWSRRKSATRGQTE